MSNKPQIDLYRTSFFSIWVLFHEHSQITGLEKKLNPILSINNAHPSFLIDTVIKKYLHYKFSSNENQLKDLSDVSYFKLPYIDNLSHHIKNKLCKLCKEFCKENFNIKLVFNSFKIKNYFSYKDPIPDALKSFLAVVLAILVELLVILKLGLRNLSKRITSLIFLNIYTPQQHALTHIILFV